MEYTRVSLLLFIFTIPVLCLSAEERVNPQFAADISRLQSAYPDVEFSNSYDSEAEDWKITVVSEGGESVLYYADGRFVSPEQLADKEHYRRLMYRVR